MTVDRIPIGRFSTVTRLTRKALRLYDKRELLVPKAKDNITRYRYYTGARARASRSMLPISRDCSKNSAIGMGA